ncbi:MAG TPA: DUF5916 domain-containing protein [Gemmatimonadaceae bacterium]
MPYSHTRTLLAWLCLAPLPAIAQTGAGSARPSGATNYGHTIAVPSAVAVRREGRVTLDGTLDEPAWRAATPITEFTQLDPDEGRPASQRTEVRFLFDDDALYVGAKMYDTMGPAGIITRLVRRDASFDSDYFQLVIDAYHDHLSRAFFEVDPSGSQADRIGIGNSCCDNSWDPIWEAATRIDPDGWTAEIRIPYSQLRFSRAVAQTWGLEVRRFIKRREEEDDWSFWHKNEAGGPPRFGHLEGLRIQSSSSHLELLPYASAKSSSLAANAGTPFDTHGRPTMRGGLDLRDNVTSNLTLNATINPDFGQVEVDPAVLNLSAFETFFPEKRPFFVENSQVFDFGLFNCNFCSNVEGMQGFYSRRVGRAPSGADLATDNYRYADIPDATTILGAGKLTGRTSSGYTVGLLEALTGQADARVALPNGNLGSQEVEPLANYFVGRLKRDLLHGNLVVGGMLSGVTRNIDTTFAPRLARNAEMYGNDVVYRWADNKYSLMANAAVTNVSGDRREIELRQQSSARYFQRPDRGPGWGGFFSSRYDTMATSLRGVGAYARIAKETGDWTWETAVNTRTPGFETNDYSFQRSADYIWGVANLTRFWSKQTRWYQTMVGILGTQTQENYEGDRTGQQFHQFLSITTRQFWNVSEFLIVRPSVMDDRQLRGGPVVRQPSSTYGVIDISTDSRHMVTGTLDLERYADQQGGHAATLALTAGIRPAPNVSFSFGPSWNPQRLPAQYVTAVADPTAVSFYGTRYVVSSISQQSLSFDTRLSWTFTPRMTLELYMQPFFAAGHYYDFKEYSAPRTATLRVYGRDVGTIAQSMGTDGVVSQYTIDPDGAGPAPPFTIDNPDVNDRSLRGNAVFRWEYRPGSVLYVAWTHSRAAGASLGDLQLHRDTDAILASRPDNIFLIKASWWLPI